jgi:hypothetical protein
MKHGMKDKKRMGMMYGGRKSAAGGMYMMDKKKRMPKNMGGVANAQPMYSEDMPKAMPN